MQFETLPGFREFYPEACARRNYIFAQWRKVAHAFNFSEYDAPVLEPLELYIEKSGAEIVDQLFNFEDRGGRAVAMRPEMTPSLARLVGAKANGLKRPIKWFNIGEHYRYERPQKGRLRAFYQYNVDIFGEAGPTADAELIALLAQALQAFGLSSADFKIRLSDRDLWLLMLAAEGLDEAASAAVLGVVDKLERMDREKAIEKLEQIIGAEASVFLERIEKVVTIRDFDQLSTYMRGLAHEGAIADQINARLDDWELLLSRLNATGVGEFIQIDFGIVRGLAYYTGFVFEAFEASGAGRALAGGGRYDALVKKLGGPDMPAVGFAMGDVTLADLLDAKNLTANYAQSLDFVVIIGGSEARDVAIGDAARIRRLGYSVDYPLKDQSFGKQFKEANQKGARFGLIYGSDEIEQGIFKVKDFVSGGEKTFSREDLEQTVVELVRSGLE